MAPASPSIKDISETVTAALREDIGSGDVTAALIPEQSETEAWVISREEAVICGAEWVNAVFDQLDEHVVVEWFVSDGQRVAADQRLFRLQGNTRNILTGERTALNFLQLLSGTATITAHYVEMVKGMNVALLDTRKTIPGLRTAQKYAVACGGGKNHRMGLYDAYLIKENHILGCGSIAAAIEQARVTNSDMAVEVEVESLTELDQALAAEADIIMLDNFSIDQMRRAVTTCAGRALLEASGNVTADSLVDIASTGVDYISIGALTKDCRAVDLSLRLQRKLSIPQG